MFAQLFDIVPRNTSIMVTAELGELFGTVTAKHGELFDGEGYFGHGPIQDEKVYEVPFVKGKLR